jgi:hypothetical protein
MNDGLLSGSATAKKAVAILTRKTGDFVLPTPRQKKNLVVAFAKNDMIIYGKAFDLVRLKGAVNLDVVEDVERCFELITILEIKSTRKALPDNFAGFFFALTAAEVLVAQSLKQRFRFVFVNTNNGSYFELGLNEIFARARGIYPTWSIMF